MASVGIEYFKIECKLFQIKSVNNPLSEGEATFTEKGINLLL